jgi:hypothetical protein
MRWNVAPYFSLRRSSWIPTVITRDAGTGLLGHFEGDDCVSYEEAMRASEGLLTRLKESGILGPVVESRAGSCPRSAQSRHCPASQTVEDPDLLS